MQHCISIIFLVVDKLRGEFDEHLNNTAEVIYFEIYSYAMIMSTCNTSKNNSGDLRLLWCRRPGPRSLFSASLLVLPL